MKNIEYFGFIQFYTDNGSVGPKNTFVLVFFEAETGGYGIFLVNQL